MRERTEPAMGARSDDRRNPPVWGGDRRAIIRCGAALPAPLPTWHDTLARRSCPPCASSARQSSELQQAQDVLGETLEHVIPALHHDLFGAGIARHGFAVVEHLVAGFHHQQVA